MSTAAPPGLVPRMIGFLGHLRENDFAVGPAEAEAALRLFEDGRWLPRARARLGLRILLASRPEEWRRFDDLFEAYWLRRGRVRDRTRSTAKAGSATGKQHPAIWEDHLASRKGGPPKPGVVQEAVSGDDDDAAEGGKNRLIASRQTMIQRTDLRHLTDPDDIAAAERLACRLARAIRYRLSRRYRIDPKGNRLDLRRTIRANLAGRRAPRSHPAEKAGSAGPPGGVPRRVRLDAAL